MYEVNWIKAEQKNFHKKNDALKLASTSFCGNSVWDNYNSTICPDDSISSMNGTLNTLMFASLGLGLVGLFTSLFKKPNPSESTQSASTPQTQAASQTGSEVAETNKNINEVIKAIADYNNNGNVDGLKTVAAKQNECEAQVNTIKEMTVKPQQDCKNAEGELTVANNDYKKAETELKDAKTAELGAETSFNNAKAAYDKEPANSPNKAALETQMKNARQKLDQARQAREKAEKNLEEKGKFVKEKTQVKKDAGKALETAKKSQDERMDANQKWAKAIQNAIDLLIQGGYEVPDSKQNDTKSTVAGTTEQIPITARARTKQILNH